MDHIALDLINGRLPPNNPKIQTLRVYAAGALAAIRAGRRPADDALRHLNDTARAAPAHRELHWDGTALAVTSHRAGDDDARLLATLADATIDLLTDPRAHTVRECEAPDCVMLFLPAHPRRRWCDPSVCGNRMRVARHYRRHKAEADD